MFKIVFFFLLLHSAICLQDPESIVEAAVKTAILNESPEAVATESDVQELLKTADAIGSVPDISQPTKKAAPGLSLSKEQIDKLADKILLAHGVTPDADTPQEYRAVQRLRKVVSKVETNLNTKVKEAIDQVKQGREDDLQDTLNTDSSENKNQEENTENVADETDSQNVEQPDAEQYENRKEDEKPSAEINEKNEVQKENGTEEKQEEELVRDTSTVDSEAKDVNNLSDDNEIKTESDVFSERVKEEIPKNVNDQNLGEQHVEPKEFVEDNTPQHHQNANSDESLNAYESITLPEEQNEDANENENTDELTSTADTSDTRVEIENEYSEKEPDTDSDSEKLEDLINNDESLRKDLSEKKDQEIEPSFLTNTEENNVEDKDPREKSEKNISSSSTNAEETNASDDNSEQYVANAQDESESEETDKTEATEEIDEDIQDQDLEQDNIPQDEANRDVEVERSVSDEEDIEIVANINRAAENESSQQRSSIDEVEEDEDENDDSSKLETCHYDETDCNQERRENIYSGEHVNHGEQLEAETEKGYFGKLLSLIF